jgi:hypothetical protein
VLPGSWHLVKGIGSRRVRRRGCRQTTRTMCRCTMVDYRGELEPICELISHWLVVLPTSPEKAWAPILVCLAYLDLAPSRCSFLRFLSLSPRRSGSRQRRGKKWPFSGHSGYSKTFCPIAHLRSVLRPTNFCSLSLPLLFLSFMHIVRIPGTNSMRSIYYRRILDAGAIMETYAKALRNK